jgi:CRP-like cAMP-binding protein
MVFRGWRKVVMGLPLLHPCQEVIAMVLLDMLEGIDFLKEFPPEYLGNIAAIGELREYPADAVLFEQGKESCHVYLLVSGKVELEMRVADVGLMPIQEVAPGELLGWSPVLEVGPMTATARARTPCRVIALNVRRLQEMCKQAPEFGMEFLRRAAATAATRLSSTRLRLLNLVSVASAGSNGMA